MKKFILSVMLFVTSLSFAGQNIGDVVLKEHQSGKVQIVKNFKKKTYIKVWASWCPICLATMPHTAELTKEKNLDFNVISVVTPGIRGEQSKESFKKWFPSVKEFEGAKVYFDDQDALVRKLRIRGVPNNVFVDSNGNVVRTIPGPLGNDTIKSIMSKIK